MRFVLKMLEFVWMIEDEFRGIFRFLSVLRV